MSNPLDRLFQLTPQGTLGNRYRLDRCLGDGTYGFVWKAERLDDHELVAVKIPKAQGGKNSDLEEGRALIDTPSHPNVVSVYWMGRVPPEREVFAIEMEYFNSNPLAFLLDSRSAVRLEPGVPVAVVEDPGEARWILARTASGRLFLPSSAASPAAPEPGPWPAVGTFVVGAMPVARA